VLLARLRAGADAAEIGATFTDRLVVKFGLPVTGWRGRGGARLEMTARQRGEEPGGDA
jgi:hypothetical protein